MEVCPENALVTVKQDEEIVDKLRRNWEMWENLPDTDDRYVNITDLEHGIGILPTLLLKKGNYRTMAGGDGACMGCGEKTAVHILISTIEGLMQPRVDAVRQEDRRHHQRAWMRRSGPCWRPMRIWIWTMWWREVMPTWPSTRRRKS